MGVKKQPKPVTRFVVSVATLCLVSVLFLTLRIEETQSARYAFLLWNLLLAAIPLFLSAWLISRIQTGGWYSYRNLLLFIVWLLFLPNSFYLVTDFVHLRPTFEAVFLYDIVLVFSFAITGLVLGYASVFMIHGQLIKKFGIRWAWYAVVGIFALSSFAIYLGRFSRWNSWDILLAPAGLLFDVSDRVVNPGAHAETYITSAVLFVLLTSVYWVIWESAEYLKS